MRFYKIKKVILLIFSNIIIFIVCCFMLELITFAFDYFLHYKNSYIAFGNKYNVQPYYNRVTSFQDSYNMLDYRKRMFDYRKPEGLEYNKRPIVLLGCSFTYGTNLENNQTFGYKLSKYTKRPVYNIAFPGWGINHVLWQLKNAQNIKDIKNPEYVIYTFIPDHINRMYGYFYFNYDWYFSPNYKTDKNGQLKEALPRYPFLYNFYFVRFFNKYLNYYLYCGDNENTYNKNFDLLKKHFYEAHKEIKKLYPNAKFVILKYPQIPEIKPYFIETSRWKELETPSIDSPDNDIIIIDIQKLLGFKLTKDYYLENNDHPNEKAWDTIVPKLSENLHL